MSADAQETPAQPNALIAYRVGLLETAVSSIALSLNRLANLETTHAESREAIGRAFKSLDDHETRIRDVEAEMPTLKLARKWVIAATVGIWTIAGALVVKLVYSGLGL